MDNVFAEDSFTRFEPRVCFRLSCNFPFGTACTDCWNHYFVAGKARSDTSSVSEQWEPGEEAKTKAPISSDLLAVAKNASSLHDQQATGEGTKTKESTSSKLIVIKYDAPDALDTVNQGRNITSSYSKQNRVLKSEEVQHRQSRELTTNSAEASSSLDLWTDQVLLETLETHLEGKGIFEGGAEEGNPENICSICLLPLGDPDDQHYLRCKYAHEEQEAMDRMLQRRAEKQVRRV